MDAGCTDAGYNSTFCLMPTVYISYNTLAIIWAIQSMLSASFNKRKTITENDHSQLSSFIS